MNRDPGKIGEGQSEPSEIGVATATAGGPAGISARGRRIAFWVTALAILISVVVQASAERFDHQNANLAMLISLAVAAIVDGVVFQRFLHAKGQPLLFPVCLAVMTIAGAALIRFEGFSGEMWPEFSYRFSGRGALPLQQDPLASTGSNSDGAVKGLSQDGTPDLLATEKDLVDKGEDFGATGMRVAPVTSYSQFLGPNRNGVIKRREFSVPASADEVEVLWNQGVGEGWSSFAVDQTVAITTEQRGQEECLTAYRISDGALLWIQKHPGRHEDALGGIGPRSTPSIVGERVFATTATGFLWCVDRMTGDIHWTVDLLDLAGWDDVESFEAAAPWGYSASPLVVGERCIVPLGGPDSGLEAESPGPALVALDAKTGTPIWKSGSDQISYASPVLMELDGSEQIVSVNEATVSSHAVEDGAELWSFSWPGSTRTSATCPSAVQVDGQHLLLGKGYGGGSALVEVRFDTGQWSAEAVWRSHRVLKTKFNHTCVSDGVGYAISNGSLQAVRLEDGAAYWTQPRRSRAAQGQVLLVEDTLVVQTEKGDVVLADASLEGYRERLRLTALDSKTWNIPSLAGRLLLVRNDRQAICFRLPARRD